MYDYIDKHLHIQELEIVAHPDPRSWVTWDELSVVLANIREIFQQLRKLRQRIEQIERNL